MGYINDISWLPEAWRGDHGAPQAEGHQDDPWASIKPCGNDIQGWSVHDEDCRE